MSSIQWVRRASVILLSVAATGPLYANAAGNLEDVIVTARRVAEPLSRTLASATVVTRADLERQQAQTLDEVLARSTGFALVNNGGIGKASFVFVRGAESDQNLVLIDGTRVGSTTLGTTALQDIPLEQIERIEIVRGPRSALYGSEALGGVIQVFTRRGARDGSWRPEFSFGGGSHGTQRASASVGGGDERRFLRVGASYLASNGTNACEGFGAPRFVGCFTSEPDDDGYRNASFSARGGVTAGVATSIEAALLYTEGRVEYDSSFANVADFNQLAASLSVTHPLNDRLTLRAHLGRAEDNSENLARGALQSRLDTTRDSASVLLDATLGGSGAGLTDGVQLTLGLDFGRDRVAGNTAYLERSRDTAGAFAQAAFAHGAQQWLASLRRDDNQQFGGETTGSLAWGYALAPAWRVTASASTAFKAPTFNDLYFPGFGNPALGPETSVGVETSLRYDAGATRTSVTAFENRIDDLIGFDTGFRPVNIDETRIRGLELEGSTRWRLLDLRGSIEWLEPQNRSAGALRGKTLPRRAERSAKLGAGLQLGPVRLGADLLYSGTRWDNLANTRRLGGYSVVDLLVDWRVAPAWRIQGRIANALDRSWQTAAFYPQPGREVFFTVRYAPDSRSTGVLAQEKSR